MPFVLICRDKPGHLETRKATRTDHLAYVEATAVVAQAGPIVENGDMAGSILILNVDTRQEAEAWAEDDPYAKAGLFGSVEILHWNKVIG